MTKEIDILEFLKLRQTLPFIDVRTPAEFSVAHIPGAVNIPIFTDEERKIIGTLYKQKGRNKAVMEGLRFVGPKLYALAMAGKETASRSEIMVHCWRGGMRSQSMAWLFGTSGLGASVLKGGYKSYRTYIQSAFAQKLPLVVLGGMTGSGKTHILHQLQNMGEQIIDLEGLAHHKGSAFGAIGQEEQPSTEMFENVLGEYIFSLDPNRRIWIEDESRMVGRVALPDALFQQMRQANVIQVIEPMDIRINRLVDEYACFDKQLLYGAIGRIHKRLGGLLHQKALDALEQNDFHKVASISLDYYDKAYMHGLNKREAVKVQKVHCPHGDVRENAEIILRMLP